tara:strand:+ start:8036 stop:8875 length:840 start_codon:yes stop_codon:yes gene_type:complete
MRNNQDRLGVGAPEAPVPQSHEPPQVTNQLDFIAPVEVVELPSKGLFYDEGHPLYEKDSIEIKHMTTKEEDILTNQSFIKNGTVIDRLLQSVIVTPGVKVRDMIVGDKDALTIACRKHGYGADYETSFNCPSCGTKQEYTFDLEDIDNKDFMSQVEEFDASVDYDKKVINFIIPRTQTKLQLALIFDTQEDKKKSKKSKLGAITSLYRKIIRSVNGNSDPIYIRSYIDSMTAVDSRYLRAAYSRMTPGIDFSCHFECSHCDHEGVVEVPLNAEFFWLKS